MKPVPPDDGEQFRVLIIGDDAATARVLTQAMSALQLDCRHAPDGALALRALAAVNPHLVLLDLQSPGDGGVRACTELRAVTTVPIIIVTALDGEDEQVQGFKVGADDYIIKPFKPRLLAARVMARLRRAYRYDSHETQSAGAAPGITPGAPRGWATCERCGYMGPRARFEHENALGQLARLCPACREADHIVFSLG